MSKDTTNRKSATHTPRNVSLVAEVEIVREERVENPSLNMKLQEELAKPCNSATLDDANDRERIDRLKAPEGMITHTFSRLVH